MVLIRTLRLIQSHVICGAVKLITSLAFAEARPTVARSSVRSPLSKPLLSTYKVPSPFAV
jgi:hypothetical protein